MPFHLPGRRPGRGPRTVSKSTQREASIEEGCEALEIAFYLQPCWEVNLFWVALHLFLKKALKKELDLCNWFEWVLIFLSCGSDHQITQSYKICAHLWHYINKSARSEN